MDGQCIDILFDPSSPMQKNSRMSKHNNTLKGILYCTVFNCSYLSFWGDWYGRIERFWMCSDHTDMSENINRPTQEPKDWSGNEYVYIHRTHVYIATFLI